MRYVIAVFALLLSADLLAAQKVVASFESAGMRLQVEHVGSGFRVPWAMEFIDEHTVLINQKSGSVIRYRIDTAAKEALEGLPEIFEDGQGGLLDLAQRKRDPKGWYYFTYTKHSRAGTVTVLARAMLKANTFFNWQVLLETQSGSNTGRHFGSRIAFDETGHVFFGVGDRGVRDSAQSLNNHNGAVIRLGLDGRVPSANPFVSRQDALPEIWSYGHRNPQGLVYDTHQQRLWLIEHGPRGGDEINLVQKGRNYGWPVISYGKEYWGPLAVGEGTHREGMEQPIKVYTPSIAPGSLVLYQSDALPGWQGNLFAGALKLRHINRIQLDDAGQAIQEERLLESMEERIRSLEVGPEGWLYFATDQGNLYRITRAD